MSLLQQVSSKTVIISRGTAIDALIASTIRASTIDGGNVFTPDKLQSSITGLTSLNFPSTLALISSFQGLGTINYISTTTLVSTTAGFQQEYKTASFLSGPNLASTVTGLGSASYVSTASLLSTVAGLGQRFISGVGIAAAGSNFYSTFTGLSQNFFVSSLTVSTMNRARVSPINPNILFWSGEPSGGGTWIKYSTNGGGTWLNTTGSFTTFAREVGYNGFMYVAAGAGGGTLKFSYDGSNWYNVFAGAFTGQGNGVAWNGRYWLAMGNSTDSTIKYSGDGLYWSNAVSGQGTAGVLNAVWNGNMWVATTTANNPDSVKYSFDGLNWSNKVSGSSITFNNNRGRNVVYGKGVWVITGFATSQNASIQYSLDGMNWSNITSNGFKYTPNTWYYGQGVGFNGYIFCAGGLDDSNPIRYSYNGINWQLGSGGGGSAIGSIVWTGYRFISTRDSSPASLQWSADGIFWDFGLTDPNGTLSYAMSFSSNVTPPYQQSTLQIIDYNLNYTFGSLTSSCLINPQPADLVINDFVTIDRALNRVGIGIYNVAPPWPRFTLEVLQDMFASTLGTTRMSTPSVNVSSIRFGSQAGWVNLGALQTNITSSIQINTSLALISSMYCGSTNRTLPFYTLDVNGTARISSLLVGQSADVFSSIGYRLAITHDSAVKPGTDRWTTTSDMRVKENIVEADYDMCYSNIQSLQLRRFAWASSFLETWDGTDRNVLGFIAQEVSTIFPKSVYIGDAYGYSNFHFLNLHQVNMSLYGAVKRTMNDMEALESTVKYEQTTLQSIRDIQEVVFSTLEGYQGR